MLHCRLFVKNAGRQSGIRISYGERVKTIYNPANLPQVIAAEMQEEVPYMSRLPTVTDNKENAVETREHRSSHDSGYSSGHFPSKSLDADLSKDEEGWADTYMQAIAAFDKKKAESTEVTQWKKREKGRILISGKIGLVMSTLLFADLFYSVDE
jgi:hypothetical protein